MVVNINKILFQIVSGSRKAVLGNLFSCLGYYVPLLRRLVSSVVVGGHIMSPC